MTKAHRPPKIRVSKYHAEPTSYNGVRYDSKAEAKYAKELDGLCSQGTARWYLRQPRFQLGLPENVYVADFLVVPNPEWLAQTDPFAVDVKGMETPKFRKDLKLWEQYGPCELWVVKNGRVDTVVVGGGKRVRIEDAPKEHATDGTGPAAQGE